MTAPYTNVWIILHTADDANGENYENFWYVNFIFLYNEKLGIDETILIVQGFI